MSARNNNTVRVARVDVKRRAATTRVLACHEVPENVGMGAAIVIARTLWDLDEAGLSAATHGLAINNHNRRIIELKAIIDTIECRALNAHIFNLSLSDLVIDKVLFNRNKVILP